MLLVFGVAFVALGAVLTVAARSVFYNGLLPAGVRRWIGGETIGVTLATLGGSGIVMILLFITDGSASHVGVVPAGLAMALAVAGIFGVRFIHRRGGLDDEAAGLVATLERPVPAVDQQKQAA